MRHPVYLLADPRPTEGTISPSQPHFHMLRGVQGQKGSQEFKERSKSKGAPQPQHLGVLLIRVSQWCSHWLLPGAPPGLGTGGGGSSTAKVHSHKEQFGLMTNTNKAKRAQEQPSQEGRQPRHCLYNSDTWSTWLGSCVTNARRRMESKGG